MMKTRTFIGMTLMLTALVGMTACGNEENPLNNSVQDEIEPALLKQNVPEFSENDFETVEKQFEWTTSTNGTWVIHKLNGIVCDIDYGQQPFPESPKSAEDFFKDNLPITSDDEMKKDGWQDLWIYRQYYKGIPVEQGTWSFRFDGDVMDLAYGHFVAINNNLDVTPLISEDNAKKIVASYIKDSVDGEEKCFYLAVMEFPAETTMEPRLVYVYKHDPWEYHNYVYVDAKTGRLLYQITCSGGKPYV